MKIELNNIEYTYTCAGLALKCASCSLHHIPIPFCVLLCRTGYIVRLNEHKSNIFNL
jgi:hypothetical protein